MTKKPPGIRLLAVTLLVFFATGISAFLAGRAQARALPGEGSPAAHDPFGGIRGSSVEHAQFFKLQKIGSRWTLITPNGDPFWMRAVYAVGWTEGGTEADAAFKSKYAGDGFRFAEHAVKRLKSWGFNTLGEYSSPYVLPVPTYYRPRGNPEKMPFIRFLDISWYSTIDEGGLAPGPVKTLLAGAVDPEVYKGWPGHVPDVFDPNFPIYARSAAADLRTAHHDTVFTAKTPNGGLPESSLDDSPWLIGTTPDDSDDLFGFGPGPDHPGLDGVVHPNIAWIVAVTKPTQTENTQVGAALGERQTVRYADPTVYAKRAWRDFLAKKYGTIADLNRSWNSHYTTFDSDGGWPNGKGLLDESGRNPWMGTDPDGLANASPHVRQDLNEFLGLYADQYFRVVTEAIRAATPRHLVFSPAVLDSHGGLTRPEILKAAGLYCDAIQVGLNSKSIDLIGETYRETHRPLFMWLGMTANADSPIRGSGPEALTVGTQQARGDYYATQVSFLSSYRAPDGVFPVIGIDWWEYMDKPSEKANWGLVSPRDNAYDGKEDVTAQSKDSLGFTTGGEKGDFGDFLDAVRSANSVMDQELATEWHSAFAKGQGGGRQAGIR